METLLINHKGELIQVTPIFKDSESYFVVTEEKEPLWVDVNGSVKADCEVAGID